MTGMPESTYPSVNGVIQGKYKVTVRGGWRCWQDLEKGLGLLPRTLGNHDDDVSKGETRTSFAVKEGREGEE